MPSRLRVGFQGERGAFSEVAANKLVKNRPVELVPCANFPALFRALAGRRIDYATVPIENTLHGSVHENYDLLLKYRLPIQMETRIRIVHNLIAPKGVGLRSIRKVYSHPVALRQCLKFLDKHRKWEVVPFYDTAGSVKMLAEKYIQDSAGIASAASAAIYGARILVKDIGDDKENYTRFFLLGRRQLAGSPKTPTKTSIAFATGNHPGALFHCLSVFALRDIDLTKIESRPLPGRPFEYMFYMDCKGDAKSAVVRNALKNLAEVAEFIRVLGSYNSVA